MYIRYKITILLWVLGLLTAFGVGILLHGENQKRLIQHEIATYESIVEELAVHFESDLLSKKINAITITSAPLLRTILQESNAEFAQLTESERTAAIDKLNRTWMSTINPNDQFILNYTNNEVAKYFSTQQKNQPGEFGEIFLTNRYGVLVGSTGRLTTLAHGHKYWWQAAYNYGRGRVFLDDRGFDQSVKGYVLGIVVPIKDSSDAIIGILKTNVNIEGSLTSLTREYSKRNAGVLQLVRTSGLVIAEDTVKHLSKSIPDTLKDLLSTENGRTRVDHTEDGVILRVGFPLQITRGSTEIGFGGKYETIDHMMGNKGDAWHLLLEINLTEKINNSSSSGNMILLALLFILLSVILSYALSRFIAMPVSQLSLDVKSFGDGNYTIRSSVSTRDEIGLLAQAFNTMADQIEHSETVQKDTIEELNQQVEAYESVSETLEESKRELQELFDESPIGLALCKMTGELVSVNNQYAKMLGYTIEETLKLTYWDITPQKYEEQEVAILEGVKATGSYGPYEKEYIHRDGHLIDVRLNGKMIVQDEEQLIWSSVEDISSLKRSERDRFELIKQLEESHKMEAIGTLAGGIAHDFNNILSSILGFAQLSLKEDISDELAENLTNIVDAGERAKEVVSQILTFTKKSEEELRPVVVADAVNGVVSLIQASTPSHISLKCDISSEEIVVIGNYSKIHQVLLNLCTNAVQAIGDENGTVTVELSQELFAAENSEPRNYASIRVSDTGQGISKEELDRIFEPYYTTKGFQRGSGLGLSVVKGIVNSHDGYITVNSSEGKGTVFTVLLPILQVTTPEEEKEPEPVERGSESILVVDDEPNIVKISTKVLQNYGYDVTGVTDSVEALHLFEESPEKYSLVVSDYSMPDLTGVALAGELRKIRPEIPIILCTGYSSEVDSSNARDAGFNEFLLKPVDYDTLLKSIRSILDGGV